MPAAAAITFRRNVWAWRNPLMDRLRTGYETFLELLRRRRERGQLTCSLNCVLLRDNLEEAPALLRWARERELPLSFVLGEERERFHNRACGERFLLMLGGEHSVSSPAILAQADLAQGAALAGRVRRDAGRVAGDGRRGQNGARCARRCDCRYQR